MASRWMKNDCSGRVHSVALLSQEVPVPASLRQAVENSGGRIHIADPAGSLVNRAVWLRRLAAEDANYVILHVERGRCDLRGGLRGSWRSASHARESLPRIFSGPALRRSIRL